MLTSLTTNFIAKLKRRDETAWFELWETFGPVVRAQLAKWGRGRIGSETVRDLSQETMTALSESIDRYDPARGARFSTWLLAIAKHVLGDEMDRRSAQKRGGNQKAASFDEGWMVASATQGADEKYEAAVFRAKVEEAIRKVQRGAEFTDFEIFRMRVLESKSGKQVAEDLGMSEPTVSRRLAKVRDALRGQLRETISKYSFTPEEMAEAARNRLDMDPNKGPTAQDDAAFDEAVAEIYHQQVELRRQDQATRLESR